MIIVRTTSAQDLPLLAISFVDFMVQRNRGEHWKRDTANKVLAYWFHRQPDLAFTAEVEGEAIGGFFAIVRPWFDGNRIVDGCLFVHPEFEFAQVANQLAEVMFQTALEKYGAKHWDTLSVEKGEVGRWFDQLGFKEKQGQLVQSGNLVEALKILGESHTGAQPRKFL